MAFFRHYWISSHLYSRLSRELNKATDCKCWALTWKSLSLHLAYHSLYSHRREASPEEQVLDSSDEPLTAVSTWQKSQLSWTTWNLQKWLRLKHTQQLSSPSVHEASNVPNLTCLAGARGRHSKDIFWGGEKKRKCSYCCDQLQMTKLLSQEEKKARELFLFKILNLDEPCRF